MLISTDQSYFIVGNMIFRTRNIFGARKNVIKVTENLNVLCFTNFQISEIDFQDSILVLQFPEELNALLLQLYLDNRKEIRNILSELTPKFPSYHNLEWRLDVQVRIQALVDVH